MKKSITLFFLFTFCISLPGFSVELHYCKGDVTDFSFFGNTTCICNEEDEHAKMEQSSKSECQKHCHSIADHSASKELIKVEKSCCKTEKLTMVSPKLKAYSVTKKIDFVMTVAVLNPYFFLDSGLISKSDKNGFYIPPVLSKNYPVLHSVFLI